MHAQFNVPKFEMELDIKQSQRKFDNFHKQQ